jgi:hypothetical protein
MLMVRLGLGVGEAPFAPISYSSVRLWSPYTERGTAIAAISSWLASVGNLSTIGETEFNPTAFRFMAFAGAGRRRPRGRASAELDDSMRIATYNVNGSTGGWPICSGGWRRPRRTSSACRS